MLEKNTCATFTVLPLLIGFMTISIYTPISPKAFDNSIIKKCGLDIDFDNYISVFIISTVAAFCAELIIYGIWIKPLDQWLDDEDEALFSGRTNSNS